MYSWIPAHLNLYIPPSMHFYSATQELAVGTDIYKTYIHHMCYAAKRETITIRALGLIEPFPQRCSLCKENRFIQLVYLPASFQIFPPSCCTIIVL